MSVSVVYIANSVIPSRAANSVHVMKMCAALGSLGHRVRLLVRSLPAEEIEGVDPFAFYGVPSCFILEKLKPTPLLRNKSIFAWHASARAAAEKADLVYSRSLSASSFSAWRGIPVIYESHTPERGRASEQLYQHLARSSRLLSHVVITASLKRYYVEEKGVAPERIHVAPDGADAPGDTPPVDLGGEGRLRIGYVGHLYPGRGIGLLLELARRIREADFHLIGGAKGDIAAWTAQARDLGNVTLHGFLPPAVLDGYRHACDILLAPYETTVAISGGRGHDTSRWMSPLKLFEYMAAGKPIVASRLDAIEEVIRDGENGILCDPSDPAEWENALRRLMSDARERERLGGQAQRIFLERFTWTKRAEGILRSME